MIAKTFTVVFLTLLASTHSTPIEEQRRDDNLSDNGPHPFPNTDGIDLSLCYDVNFKSCTTVTDVQKGNCYNGWGCTSNDCKPKYNGFKNDKISAYAITGKTPARCKFYYDQQCRGGQTFDDSSADAPVKVPNIVATKGNGANDVISSFMCDDPTSISAS